MFNATGGTFTYDGAPKAGSGTATGAAGETLTVTLSYSGADSTVYGPSATAPSAAGTYAVTASTTGDANNAPGTSSPATLTINQATPLVNATGGTFNYNGAPETGSGTATGGAGETLTVTLSYSGTDSTVYGPSTTAPSAAGTYAVTASTAGDANNTSGISSPVTLTINKVGLAITANSTTKVYGTTLTFAGTEFTHGTLYSGDSISTVTLTSAGQSGSAAEGTYSIVPISAVGTGLTNYNINYINGTLIVGAAAPTVASLTPIIQTNNATTTASFAVSVTGPSSSTNYQWVKITATATNVLTDGGNITGSASNVLTIANVLAADQATYAVTITNLAGSVTTNATLVVIDPAILAQPVGVVTNLGSDVTFSVTAAGTGASAINGNRTTLICRVKTAPP